MMRSVSRWERLFNCAGASWCLYMAYESVAAGFANGEPWAGAGTGLILCCIVGLLLHAAGVKARV